MTRQETVQIRTLHRVLEPHRRRWRIRIRSGSSWRRVPVQRSVIAFAPGCSYRGVQDAEALTGEHGIEGVGKRAIAVPGQERELSCAVAEVHHQVPCLLGNPGAGGVGGDAQQVDAAGGVLYHEQYGEPVTQHGLDAEEVGGENAVGLGSQELAPAVPTAVRCRVDAGSLRASSVSHRNRHTVIR